MACESEPGWRLLKRHVWSLRQSCRPAPEVRSTGNTKRPGLRGLPEDRLSLGAPASMSYMRPRWLLRLVSEPARQKTLLSNGAPDRAIIRARRGLALVLRGRNFCLNLEGVK
jgi:hypothetical protein